MEFLKQTAGQVLGGIFSKIPNTTAYMYTVKEIEPHQKFETWPLLGQEDNNILRLVNNVTYKYYECILYNPAVHVRPFSLFRLSDAQQARSEFLTVHQKLHPIYMSSFTCYSVASLQTLCDCIRDHPTWSAAHIAVYCGVVDCLKNNDISRYLNSTQCDWKRTPLLVSCMTDNVQCMIELLDLGVRTDIFDSNGDNVYHYAARSDQSHYIEILASKDTSAINYPNYAQETPLHQACLEKKEKNVRLLLQYGADANMIGRHGYPIHYAMKSSSVQCAQIMLEVFPQLANAQDSKYGGTALHWARTAKDVDILIKLGCNLEAMNKTGDTPLHIMVIKKRLDCIMSLLCAGANVNSRGQYGNTPLHLAVQMDKVDLIYTLVTFGADVNALNERNDSPRHLVSLSRIKHRPQILYALHMVGAQRCHSMMKSCNEGCRYNGQYDGEPPEKFQMDTNPANQAYDDFLALTVVSAALKRNRSVDKEKMGLDEVDCGASSPMKPTKRNFDTVLSLDGGGIRGLILIQLLIALEKYAQVSIKNLFDWIGGTSTGGILALAIVHGHSLREMQSFYFRMKNEVFQGKRPYDSEPLERVMKEEFGENTMMDAVQSPRVLVTGVLGDRNPPTLHFFRNFEATPNSSVDQTVNLPPYKPPPKPNEQLVWRAARSSGAAPTYFRAVGRFLDGGLIANNPTLDILTEIHEFNLYHKQQGQNELVRSLGVVVSLGTGKLPVKPIKHVDVYRPDSLWDMAKNVMSAVNLGQILLEQVTESAYRPVDRSRAWCSMIDVPFYRFNPQLSSEVMLDETSDSVLVRMLWETQCYIHQNKEKFEQLAILLKS